MKRILFVFSMVLSASVAFAVDNKENLENETGLQRIGPGSFVINGGVLSKVSSKSQSIRQFERRNRQEFAELFVQVRTRLHTAFNAGKLPCPAILRSQLPGVSKKSTNSKRKVRFQDSPQNNKTVQN